MKEDLAIINTHLFSDLKCRLDLNQLEWTQDENFSAVPTNTLHTPY